MAAHSQFFFRSRSSEVPSIDEIDALLYQAETIYDSARVNIDGFDSYDNFVDRVYQLDFQSSPGYPFMFEAPTIGDWLKFNGAEFDEIQLKRLWILVSSLFSGSLDSLWRVFIKVEPHKIAKRDSGRWRLIMCPPLHVQVAWQMVFAKQNDREVELAFHLPSQQGMQLCGGAWKHFYGTWKQKRLTVSADRSAWDWSCSEWMIETDLKLRSRLVYGSDVCRWMSMALKLYDDAFRSPKLLLSDGSILRQDFPGVMKSGCVNTISTNSHCQVFLHLLYCNQQNMHYEPLLSAVGDDTLQHEQHVAPISWYARYGVVIKQVVKGYEFVGHKFSDAGPVPCYNAKHIYRYIYCPEDIEFDLLESYLYLYSQSDEWFKFWSTIAELSGMSHLVKSRQFYKFWYNSPYSVKDFDRLAALANG